MTAQQRLTSVITASELATRNQSLDLLCREASLEALLKQGEELDGFRRHRDNLYERVRALFFLYALHRFHLPARSGLVHSLIPYEGYTHLLQRRFEDAIDV